MVNLYSRDQNVLNYYVIMDLELKKKNDDMVDGVYDIDENEFIRRSM